MNLGTGAALLSRYEASTSAQYVCAKCQNALATEWRSTAWLRPGGGGGRQHQQRQQYQRPQRWQQQQQQRTFPPRPRLVVVPLYQDRLPFRSTNSYSTRSSTRSSTNSSTKSSTNSSSSSTDHKTSPSPPSGQQQETVYALFPRTFPGGPAPASPFTPDARKLRKEFLRLQAKTHPDLVPASQKSRAEAQSSRVNEAYRILQDPLLRAQYLLSLRGIDVQDENSKLDGLENELLMEVMEAREAVDEADTPAELDVLKSENEEKMRVCVAGLESCFARAAEDRGADAGANAGAGASAGAETWVDEAVRLTVRLRYLVNIQESIRGWEKGKGGGAVHH